MDMVSPPTTLREVGLGCLADLHGDGGWGSRPSLITSDVVERFRRMAELGRP